MATPHTTPESKNYTFNLQDAWVFTGTVKDLAGNPIDLTVGAWGLQITRSGNPAVQTVYCSSATLNADGTFQLISEPIDHYQIQTGNLDYRLAASNDVGATFQTVQNGKLLVGKGPTQVS